jgi:virginiamycin B lyase
MDPMPRTRRERIAAMRTTRLPKLYTAALSAALTAALLVPAAAGAAPAVDGVFDLPSTPHRLALGPDGNVWVTMDGATDNIARIAPEGRVDTFTSADISSPFGIVAGPDGQLWVTMSNSVAHFSPSDPTAARRVTVTGLASATTIAVGPDRNLWTTSGDQAFRIGTDESVRAFRPAGLQSGLGIAAGGDGNLYVADFLGAQIVAFAPGSEITQLYPTGGGNPQQVAAGPGGQMAFTNPLHDPQQIGRFSPPDASSVRTADFAPGTDPFGIVFAEDGAYWVANRSDSLTRMAPDGTITTLGGFPRDSNPRYLTLGRDGTLWVGLETSRQVARVTGVVAPTTGGGGTGGGGGTRADTARPTISHMSFPLLRVGRSATLKLTLSEAASVRVRWERKLAGRRKAGRCVKPRRAPHGRRCARFKALGTQTRSGVRGANRLAIAGKIERHTIPAGFYRLTLVATDAAGNASKPVTQVLEVNRREKRSTRRGATL